MPDSQQSSPQDPTPDEHTTGAPDGADPDPRTGDQGSAPSSGQVSEGPSGAMSVERLGGADAVPETPDNVPADRDLDIRDAEASE